MSTVSGGCTPNTSFTILGQLGTNAAGEIPQTLNLKGTLSSGTGADQISLIHAKTYTFAASTPQTIDLQSLLDIQGNAISFAAVRWLLYRIRSTNAAYKITAGGAGANEWVGWLTSGSTMLWYPSTATNDGYCIVQAPTAAGMPVTSGSRLLKLDPGANAVGLVDLIIVGS